MVSHTFEYPDEAGYPDEGGFLDEGTKTLIAEIDDSDRRIDVPLSDFDLQMLNDVNHSRYAAWIDGEEAATMPYRLVGGRMVLLTTTVREDLRGKGVAIEFIAHVLDDIRHSGRKVTNYCPIVRVFLDRFPQYVDVLDTARPGVTSESVRAAAQMQPTPSSSHVDDDATGFEGDINKGDGEGRV
jgi:predicted GNAT family acetyltransferase